MILYQTPSGPIVQHQDQYHRVMETDWDKLINRDDLVDHLTQSTNGPAMDAPEQILAPIGSQEGRRSGWSTWR